LTLNCGFYQTSCVATQEVDNQWITRLTPNPAKDNLTVNFKAEKTELITLEIVNELGQILLKNNVNANVGDNATTLNIHDLPTGFYVLKLSTASKIGTQKFVKN
jgi:Secretion system C-terminal sorting domain